MGCTYVGVLCVCVEMCVWCLEGCVNGGVVLVCRGVYGIDVCVT